MEIMAVMFLQLLALMLTTASFLPCLCTAGKCRQRKNTKDYSKFRPTFSIDKHFPASVGFSVP
jgi:hypothetical protein